MGPFRAAAASAVVAVGCLLTPPGVAGQDVAALAPGASDWTWSAPDREATGRGPEAASAVTGGWFRVAPQDAGPADRARAVNSLLSIAVPGAGQLRAGQRRGWAYLAVEALAWAGWAERRYRGRQLQGRYRDVAWERARLQVGPRVDPEWAYYETLTKWMRSGGYDVDAAPGLQPEMDPSTYNGSIWALARGLFLPEGGDMGPSTPGWERALDYYRRRAWDDRFLWDWSSDPGARQEFTNIIASSDDRFRQATHVLGVILANHVVSGVDAYLTGGVGRTAASLRLEPSGLGGPAAGRWLLTARWDGLP